MHNAATAKESVQNIANIMTAAGITAITTATTDLTAMTNEVDTTDMAMLPIPNIVHKGVPKGIKWYVARLLVYAEEVMFRAGKDV